MKGNFLLKYSFNKKCNAKNLSTKIIFSVPKLGEALSRFQFSTWKIQGSILVWARHAQSRMFYLWLHKTIFFQMNSPLVFKFALPVTPGVAAWML